MNIITPTQPINLQHLISTLNKIHMQLEERKLYFKDEENGLQSFLMTFFHTSYFGDMHGREGVGKEDTPDASQHPDKPEKVPCTKREFYCAGSNLQGKKRTNNLTQHKTKLTTTNKKVIKHVGCQCRE